MSLRKALIANSPGMAFTARGLANHQPEDLGGQASLGSAYLENWGLAREAMYRSVVWRWVASMSRAIRLLEAF